LPLPPGTTRPRAAAAGQLTTMARAAPTHLVSATSEGAHDAPTAAHPIDKAAHSFDKEEYPDTIRR